MKAAVYYGPRDIRIEDVPTPTPGPNELLVAVKACGICGSDLHTYRYGLFEDLGMEIEGQDGRLMGHEFSGVVAEVGSEVQDVKIGDRLAGIGRGAYAEYAIVEVAERSYHPLPGARRLRGGRHLRAVRHLAARRRAGRPEDRRDGRHHRVPGSSASALSRRSAPRPPECG